MGLLLRRQKANSIKETEKWNDKNNESKTKNNENKVQKMRVK